jgi:hypothetical protein
MAYYGRTIYFEFYIKISKFKFLVWGSGWEPNAPHFPVCAGAPHMGKNRQRRIPYGEDE